MEILLCMLTIEANHHPGAIVSGRWLERGFGAFVYPPDNTDAAQGVYYVIVKSGICPSKCLNKAGHVRRTKEGTASKLLCPDISFCKNQLYAQSIFPPADARFALMSLVQQDNKQLSTQSAVACFRHAKGRVKAAARICVGGGSAGAGAVATARAGTACTFQCHRRTALRFIEIFYFNHF
jgi:hypothetical protein